MRLFQLPRGLAGFGVVCASLGAAQAQTPTPPTRKYTGTLDLVPLLASGYQLSGEKRWGAAQRQALVVTPQLYRGPVQPITSELREGRHGVRGYGLALQHRLYVPVRTTVWEGLYLGYGPHYQHFALAFAAPSWQPERAANGLTYYEYRVRPQTATVDRVGAAAVAGRQWVLPDLPVVVDVYLGLGLRHARTRASLPGNPYGRNRSDYGASGLYLPLGFRVGVTW